MSYYNIDIDKSYYDINLDVSSTFNNILVTRIKNNFSKHIDTFTRIFMKYFQLIQSKSTRFGGFEIRMSLYGKLMDRLIMKLNDGCDMYSDKLFEILASCPANTKSNTKICHDFMLKLADELNSYLNEYLILCKFEDSPEMESIFNQFLEFNKKEICSGTRSTIEPTIDHNKSQKFNHTINTSKSLFNIPQENQSSPFGSAPAKPPQQPSLFGSAPAKPPQQPSLFGSAPAKPPQQPSLFKSAPAKPPQQPSPFGSTPAKPTQQPSIFGSTPAKPPQQPSPFGSAPAKPLQKRRYVTIEDVIDNKIKNDCLPDDSISILESV